MIFHYTATGTEVKSHNSETTGTTGMCNRLGQLLIGSRVSIIQRSSAVCFSKNIYKLRLRKQNRNRTSGNCRTRMPSTDCTTNYIHVQHIRSNETRRTKTRSLTVHKTATDTVIVCIEKNGDLQRLNETLRHIPN